MCNRQNIKREKVFRNEVNPLGMTIRIVDIQSNIAKISIENVPSVADKILEVKVSKTTGSYLLTTESTKIVEETYPDNLSLNIIMMIREMLISK
jgi:hypothetical protein